MTSAIHKVIITKESIFDYEETLFLTMPKATIKTELEEYIWHLQERNKLPPYYFNVKFYDEDADTTLLLFLYKERAIGKMQFWILKGICNECDYLEWLENNGVIRAWLTSPIDLSELQNSCDWVVKSRLLNQIDNTKTYSINGILSKR